MYTIVSLFMGVPFVAAAVLGIGGVSTDSAPEKIFESVEVGIAELSPMGERGGYAIPASGESCPDCGTGSCELTTSVSTLNPGDAFTANFQGTQGRYSATFQHEDGTMIWSDNDKNDWADGSGGFSFPVPNRPGKVTLTANGSTMIHPGAGNPEDGQYYIPPTYSSHTCSVSAFIAGGGDPDLVAGATTISKSAPISAGASIYFTGPVTNVGAESVTSVFLNRFELKSDLGVIPFSEFMGTLTSGQTRQATSASWEAAAGSWSVRLCADTDDDISESNENNNCGPWKNFTVVPTSGNLPDLVPTALTNMDPLVVGQSIRFQGTTKNNGNIAAGSHQNRFRWTYTPEIYTSWTSFATPTKSGLAVGAETTDISPGLVIGSPATIYVEYCADQDYRVDELDESNNCRIGTFEVTDPVGPSVTSCTVSPNPAETGQTVTWTANITGGTGPYAYQWSGSEGLSKTNTSISGTTNTVQKAYSNVGTKTTQVKVTDSNNKVSPWKICDTLTVESGDDDPPIVDLRVNDSNGPVTIGADESVVITWTQEGGPATSCGGSGFSVGGATENTTGLTRTPAGNITYGISCNGPGGSDSDQVEVVVEGGNPTEPPEITANPPLVDRGDTTNIVWIIPEGHTGCAITSTNNDNEVNGPKSFSGGTDSSEIYGETTYTLTCAAGSDEAMVNIRPVFEEI